MVKDIFMIHVEDTPTSILAQRILFEIGFHWHPAIHNSDRGFSTTSKYLVIVDDPKDPYMLFQSEGECYLASPDKFNVEIFPFYPMYKGETDETD